MRPIRHVLLVYRVKTSLVVISATRSRSMGSKTTRRRRLRLDSATERAATPTARRRLAATASSRQASCATTATSCRATAATRIARARHVQAREGPVELVSCRFGVGAGRLAALLRAARDAQQPRSTQRDEISTSEHVQSLSPTGAARALRHSLREQTGRHSAADTARGRERVGVLRYRVRWIGRGRRVRRRRGGLGGLPSQRRWRRTSRGRRLAMRTSSAGADSRSRAVGEQAAGTRWVTPHGGKRGGGTIDAIRAMRRGRNHQLGCSVPAWLAELVGDATVHALGDACCHNRNALLGERLSFMEDRTCPVYAGEYVSHCHHVQMHKTAERRIEALDDGHRKGLAAHCAPREPGPPRRASRGTSRRAMRPRLRAPPQAASARPREPAGPTTTRRGPRRARPRSRRLYSSVRLFPRRQISSATAAGRSASRGRRLMRSTSKRRCSTRSSRPRAALATRSATASTSRQSSATSLRATRTRSTSPPPVASSYSTSTGTMTPLVARRRPGTSPSR